MKKFVLKISANEMGLVSVARVEVERGTDILAFFRKEIACSYVDCVRCEEGDVWVDDEGLYASGSTVIEIVTRSGDVLQLAGVSIITKGVDEEGNTLLFDGEDEADVLLALVWEECRCGVIGKVA